MSRRDAVAAEIPRLRRYARALTGDGDAADDLVQDCLERALTRLDQWRHGESPRRWLFTILHNIHADAMRRRARRPVHVAYDERDARHQGADPQTHASAGDMDRALQQLSEEQRAVVLLVGLEGLSYAEAAAVLGIPAGTVMSRLARGREKLRVLMQETGDGRSRPSLRRIK